MKRIPRRPRLRVLCLLPVLTLAVGLAGCDESEPTPEPQPASSPQAMTPQQLDQAEADLELLQKKFSSAIKNSRSPEPLESEARALTQTYPAFPPAHMLLAQVLMRQRKIEPALAALDRSLELDPSQAQAWRLSGNVMMMLEDYSAAAEKYQGAVEAVPDSAEYRVFLANALLRSGRVDQAERELRVALRLNGGAHRAHALLADVYAERGEFAAAQQELHDAIGATADDEARARLSYTIKRASLLRETGQTDAALNVLRSLPPEHQMQPAVAASIAQTWDAAGQPERAAEHYEQILLLDATNAHAVARAARWRLRIGQPTRAAKHIEKLRRLDPRHAELGELTQRLNRLTASGNGNASGSRGSS